jgi:hypothetical protein
MQEDLHHLMLSIRQPVTDILGNATGRICPTDLIQPVSRREFVLQVIIAKWGIVERQNQKLPIVSGKLPTGDQELPGPLWPNLI